MIRVIHGCTVYVVSRKRAHVQVRSAPSIICRLRHAGRQANVFKMAFNSVTCIQVSYGSTVKDDADKVPIFYRTLPSNMAANFGRLVLLEKHKWYRIGILKSAKEEYYLQVSCMRKTSMMH